MTPDFLPISLVWRVCERGGDWFINRLPATRLKLEITVNDPSSWSQIRIVNSGKKPVTLIGFDWCVGRRRNRRCFDSVVDLDDKILPESIWERTFSPYGIFRENAWRFSEGKDIHTLRFRVHTSSGRMRIFPVGEELIGCLKKSHPDKLS